MGRLLGMSARWASVCLLTLILSGCKHPSAAVANRSTARPTVAEDPDKQLFEQMRSGKYQLSAAQDDLQSAREMATKVSKVAGGTTGRVFEDLFKKLDAAGELLGDFSEDLPSLEEFKKDLSAEDDQRLDAIQSSNDALGDIADAQDIVENLLAGAPPDMKPEVQKIQDQLDDTADGVESAIVSMGGKVDEDPPVPPGTAGVGAGG